MPSAVSIPFGPSTRHASWLPFAAAVCVPLITGFGVQASDGAIGHVDDFVLDGRRWTVAGLVVATRNWLPGKRVLVAPEAVERIEWPERWVRVRLTRDALRQLPGV